MNLELGRSKRASHRQVQRYGYSKDCANAIGVVSEYGSLTEYQNQGVSHKRLTFKITDLSNQSIKVSLFQDKAIEMYNFLSQGDDVKVVALHLARIQIYDGDQLPMLTQAPSQAHSETSADIQLALSNPLNCKTVQEIREEKRVYAKLN
ncbi:hypothetical protein RIF29_40527 [Crotalaria pallida]|uniref:Uncharacterized protein n=1 Tax=Crotalaria pallida TaxID=3830 RepID=A0AAN9E3N8_CROPI